MQVVEQDPCCRRPMKTRRKKLPARIRWQDLPRRADYDDRKLPIARARCGLGLTRGQTPYLSPGQTPYPTPYLIRGQTPYLTPYVSPGQTPYHPRRSRVSAAAVAPSESWPPL